jgi:hypothetical protein
MRNNSSISQSPSITSPLQSTPVVSSGLYHYPMQTEEEEEVVENEHPVDEKAFNKDFEEELQGEQEEEGLNLQQYLKHQQKQSRKPSSASSVTGVDCDDGDDLFCDINDPCRENRHMRLKKSQSAADSERSPSTTLLNHPAAENHHHHHSSVHQIPVVVDPLSLSLQKGRKSSEFSNTQAFNSKIKNSSAVTCIFPIKVPPVGYELIPKSRVSLEWSIQNIYFRSVLGRSNVRNAFCRYCQNEFRVYTVTLLCKHVKACPKIPSSARKAYVEEIKNAVQSKVKYRCLCSLFLTLVSVVVSFAF